MALKTFNPTTPSQRQLVLVDRSHLWKGKPVKALTEGLSKSGGRNNLGRVSMWHRGGGHKRTYRKVDFKRGKLGVPATVERLEYDPNRTAFIGLAAYRDGAKRYLVLPSGVGVGDEILTSEKAPLKRGNHHLVSHDLSDRNSREETVHGLLDEALHRGRIRRLRDVGKLRHVWRRHEIRHGTGASPAQRRGDPGP